MSVSFKNNNNLSTALRSKIISLPYNRTCSRGSEHRIVQNLDSKKMADLFFELHLDDSVRREIVSTSCTE